VIAATRVYDRLLDTVKTPTGRVSWSASSSATQGSNLGHKVGQYVFEHRFQLLG